MIPLVKSCNHSTQHLQEVQWYSFKSQFSQRKLINHWNIPLFPSKVTPKNPITSIRPLNIPLNISTSVFNQSNDFPHDWWDFGLKSSQFYIPKFQDGSSFMGTNSSICQNPQQKSISFQSPHPLAPPLPPCRRTAAASAAAPRPPRQWWPAAAERRKCHGRRPGRWWHLAGGGKPMVDRKNGGKLIVNMSYKFLQYIWIYSGMLRGIGKDSKKWRWVKAHSFGQKHPDSQKTSFWNSFRGGLKKHQHIPKNGKNHWCTYHRRSRVGLATGPCHARQLLWGKVVQLLQAPATQAVQQILHGFGGPKARWKKWPKSSDGNGSRMTQLKIDHLPQISEECIPFAWKHRLGGMQVGDTPVFSEEVITLFF